MHSLLIKKSFFSQFSIWVINNYFLITALSGLLMMKFSHGGFLVYLYFLLLIFWVLKSYFATAKTTDGLFLFFIISMIVSSVLQNYERSLLINGISTLFPMFLFFIGRSKLAKGNQLLENGFPVYIGVAIIGLLLFVWNPTWYLNWKMSAWYIEETEGATMEMMRLSAFWTYPYWISYGGAIFYTFIINRMYLNRKRRVKDVIILFFIFLIVALAQQRAPLFWIVLITIIYVIYNFFKGGMTSSFFIIVGFVALFYIALSYLSVDFIDRFIEKYDQVIEGSFLKNRADIFSSFYDNEISFWGDGVGRYSTLAMVSLKKAAISDQGYLKILYENGIFGCLGFSFFILTSIIRGFKRIKYNLFEFSIVVLYLIGMFGANCLFSFTQHSAIFWFCLGRLSKHDITEKEHN